MTGDPAPAAAGGWPLLCGGSPLSGVYKARWEDFEVRELPRYEPEGSGDHTWFEIEKRGLTTTRAIADIGRALGVDAASIGRAGLKDARAITRQWLSVEHAAPERVLELDLPRIRVLQARRHARKLRRGWHEGNAFVVRVRPKGRLVGSRRAAGREERGGRREERAPVEWLARAETLVRERLAVLAERGVPNYYGAQRFGMRGDTWAVGRALARDQLDEAAALIAGRPDPERDPPDVLRARRLFDAGDYASAADAWPRGFAQCVRLCRTLARGERVRYAVLRVGKRMLRFYASAYQSWLFNHVLAARIDTLDTLLRGDLALRHDTGGVFDVDDPALEQPRADGWQVSPTGPLVARRMRSPGDEAGALEARVLAAAGLRPDELASPAMRPLAGARRPLRFRAEGLLVRPGDDDLGPHLELRFSLPAGAYATEVLRELGAGGLVEGRGTPVAASSRTGR